MAKTDNQYLKTIDEKVKGETVDGVHSNNHYLREISENIGTGSSSGDGSSVDLRDYIKKSDTAGLVKNDGSIDTSDYLTEHQSLSDYIQKSNTTGLVKNDGTVDTTEYLTEHQSLTNYVQKSNTAGLLKNDGTIDTTQYLSQHQDITGKVDSSDLDTLEVTVNYTDETSTTHTLVIWTED